MLGEIRPLQLDEVMVASNLADSIYQKELYEPYDAFERKYALFPEGALGYFAAGTLKGYIFSHPWNRSKVVPIAAVLDRLPEPLDCYYIHDVAVARELRGSGVGRALAMADLQVGERHGYHDCLLVSVNATDRFWEQLGFQRLELFEYAPHTSAYKMLRSAPGT